MDNGLVPNLSASEVRAIAVLILIVVDNGLVLTSRELVYFINSSLNPYCSGQWSRTELRLTLLNKSVAVLILIVVDNGLVPMPQLVRAANLAMS